MEPIPKNDKFIFSPSLSTVYNCYFSLLPQANLHPYFGSSVLMQPSRNWCSQSCVPTQLLLHQEPCFSEWLLCSCRGMTTDTVSAAVTTTTTATLLFIILLSTPWLRWSSSLSQMFWQFLKSSWIVWQHLEHNGLICWCQMMRAEEGQSALSFLMKISLLMGHEDQAFSTPLLSLVDLQRIYGGFTGLC